MRFVDGEQRNLVAGEKPKRAVLHETLGRDVEEIERACRKRAFDIVLRRAVERRIEERGLDADIAQRIDLILHQRDQRRHDDAGAGAHECRDLIAERLAAAGRHQREAILAVEQRTDDAFLMQAETFVAEHLVELGAGERHRLRGKQIARLMTRQTACWGAEFCSLRRHCWKVPLKWSRRKPRR